MRLFIVVLLILTPTTSPASTLGRHSVHLPEASHAKQHPDALPPRQRALRLLALIAFTLTMGYLYAPEPRSIETRSETHLQSKNQTKDKLFKPIQSDPTPSPVVDEAINSIWKRAETYYRTLYQEKLKRADLVLPQKDPYKIFRISPEVLAGETDESLNIRKKELLRLSHPDKVQLLDEEIIKTATERTQNILWAYGQLRSQLKTTKSA